MKKVLSFVLSVAMVICLMPAMAFAADEDAAPTTTAEETAVPTATAENATGLSQFSDADSIKNKEAVAVLVGLGIVDGMGDGTFQPAGNLTRAQASKLVATLVMSGDKSDIPAPAADPFTDVAKSYWGAGAIKFGVDNGYINGMGDGTFHPEDQVTTAQLATMLDKLLGYSVADINYQWPENAMAKATLAGLLLGITKGSYESLTRDDAAQMLYNALKATDVVKSTDTASEGAADGHTLYEPVPSTPSDEYYNPSDAVGAAPLTEQLIEKYFPNVTLDTNNAADDFGRESTVWKNGTEKITDEILDTPAFVYTSHKSGADLKKDLSAYDFAEDGELWINGLATVFGNEFDYKDVAELTDNGYRVELYTNSKGNAIDRIILEYYIPVKVTKNKDGKIEFDGYNEITDNDDLYTDISSVKKNDWIMAAPEWENAEVWVNDEPITVLRVSDDILAAYIPDQVQGTVTRVVKGKDKYDSVLKYDIYQENSSATIGGKDYSAGSYDRWASEDTDVINNMVVDSKHEIVAYLDKYGYVAFWKDAEDKDDAADWGLMRSVYRTDSTNEYGEDNTAWYAQIVDESGAIQYFKLNYDKDDTTQQLVDRILRGRDALTNVMTNMLVTYKSGAKGYTLDTVDVNDDGEVISEGISSGNDDEVKTSDKKIGDAYIASDVKVVTVKGDKTSKIEASAENGVTKKIAAPFKYVVKNDGTNDLVKTIYIVKDNATRSEDLIYVSKGNKEQLLYTNDDEKQVTGTVVEYYSKADQKPTTMIVADPNGAGIAKGWYAGYDTDGEASVLDDPATADDGVVADENVTIDSIYGDTITISGVDYSITDVAIRDTREGEDIDSIEALTDAVKDAQDNEERPLLVTFAYDTDSDEDIKPITQLYLLDWPEE